MVELGAQGLRGGDAVVAAEAEPAGALPRRHLEEHLAVARERMEHGLQLVEEVWAELGGAHPQDDLLGLARVRLGAGGRNLVLPGLERLGLGHHDAHVAASLVVDAPSYEDYAIELDPGRGIAGGITDEELHPPFEIV